MVLFINTSSVYPKTWGSVVGLCYDTEIGIILTGLYGHILLTTFYLLDSDKNN